MYGKTFRFVGLIIFIQVSILCQGQNRPTEHPVKKSDASLFPVLRSIQINLQGNAVLRWSDPGTNGVYVQRYPKIDGRDYLKVDSIRGGLSYTDLYTRTADTSLAYNLAPWISQEGYPLSKHTSISLHAAFSTCDDAIHGQWTPYQETVYEGDTLWAHPRYELWGRKLTDSTQAVTGLITFEKWCDLSIDRLNFTQAPPTPSVYYQVQVRAVNAYGDTATSPATLIRHRQIGEVSVLRLDTVRFTKDSVRICYSIAADTVEMKWFAVIKSSTDSLTLNLKMGQNIWTAPISYVLPSGSNETCSLRMEGRNLCSEAMLGTPKVYSINLNSTQWPWGYLIKWSAPENVDGIRYQLYRKINTQEFTRIVDDLSETQYQDRLSDLNPVPPVGSLHICYRIDATYPSGTVVRSLEPVCLHPIYEAKMPNAIAPQSNEYNPQSGKSRNLFEPVGPAIAGFSLLISDRNGKIIYSGTDAWNGKQNNNVKFVAEGTYRYVCKVRFHDQSQKTYSGTLSVVY